MKQLVNPRLRVLTLICAGANALFSSLFQLLVVYRLGVGEHSDLYYGTTISVVAVFTLFHDPLTNILIPMFVERDSSDDRTELLWNSLLIVIGGGIVIALLAYFPICFAFPRIYSGLSAVDPNVVGKMVASYSVYMVLFGGIAAKNCYLFACNRPIAGQLNMLVSWLVSLSLLLGRSKTVDVAAVPECLVVGSAIGLFLPNLGRPRFAFRTSQFLHHLKALVSRGVLLAIGSTIFRAEAVLDGVIASGFGAGILTVYQLFSRLLLSISTIINSGYIQPVTNHLAEDAKSGNWNGLGGRANLSAFWAAATSLACLLPIVPVLLVLRARPIARLQVYVDVLQRHWVVFVLMLGYLLGAVVWKVYVTGLVVLRMEKVFATVCALTFGAGASLKVIGANVLGLAGLACGTSIYWTLAAAIMARFFWVGLTRSRHQFSTGEIKTASDMPLNIMEAD